MRISFVLFLAVSTALAALLTLNSVCAREFPAKAKHTAAAVYNIAPIGPPIEDQNTMEAITEKMKIAERRLSEEDTGEETRKKQLEAIGLLRDLIRRAEDAIPQEVPQESPEPEGTGPLRPENRQQKLIDPNRSNPAQPDSQVQKALMRKTDREEDVRLKPASGAEAKRWDVLRPCDREEALPASEEEFPQKYKRLLEMYYRCLLKR